jgi:hypothetical protein
MKSIAVYFSVVVLIMLFGVYGCSEDNPTEPKTITFSVDGFNVSIYNMWGDGSVHTENLQGLISFDQTVSRNNETHILKWTNIVCNYNQNCVVSFNVNIDGKDYRYPDGAPSNGAEYEVKFMINDTNYSYKESCGYVNHPYMIYLPAEGGGLEQYSVLASETNADCMSGTNTIVISFVNNPTWHLNIVYMDEYGENLFFFGPNVNIAILTNRAVVGGHVTFSITGPITTYDNNYTLSNLFVSAENYGEVDLSKAIGIEEMIIGNQ